MDKVANIDFCFFTNGCWINNNRPNPPAAPEKV